MHLSTHYVVSTRRMVVFTFMTRSRNISAKAMERWLMRTSMPVGRKMVIMLLVLGLPSVMSTNKPFLPAPSSAQWLMPLK